MRVEITYSQSFTGLRIPSSCYLAFFGSSYFLTSHCFPVVVGAACDIDGYGPEAVEI